MAASPIEQAAAPYHDIDKHLRELDSVKSEEELNKKLESMNSTGFSISSWMKYLFNRDSKVGVFDPVWLTIDQYKAQAEESLQNSWQVVNLQYWSLEKRGSFGDVVESARTEQFGKVYRFTGVVECPPKFLFEEFKNNITRLPEWNPTVLKSEIIKEISPGIDLSYQVTAGGGRGIIAPRDFVILRRAAMLSKEGQVVEDSPYSYMSSGISVEVPGYPPRRDMVRGHNKVGCWYMKPIKSKASGGKIEEHTKFQWLMCCDLKGKIPQFVLDTAFASVMLDYIVHVRKFTAEAKKQGKF